VKRHVDPTLGNLSEAERNFLYAALLTNRKNPGKATGFVKEDIHAMLKRQEKTIWNALMEQMRLVQFVGSKGDNQWQLVIRNKLLCDAIKDSDDAGIFASEFTPYRINANPPQNCEDIESGDKKLFFPVLDTVPTMVWRANAISPHKKSVKSGFAKKTDYKLSFLSYSYFKGYTNINRTGPPWLQWSLGDWAASKICGEDVNLAAFTFKGSDRVFSLSDTPNSTITPASLSVNGGLFLPSIKPKTPLKDKFKTHFRPTLSQEDVFSISIEDLDSVTWEKSGENIIVPVCQL
jgi:hypothetical protein